MASPTAAATLNSLKAAPSIIIVQGIGMINKNFHSSFLKRELQLLGNVKYWSNVQTFEYAPKTQTLAESGNGIVNYCMHGINVRSCRIKRIYKEV